MPAFRTSKLRLAAFLALSALVLVLLAPVGKAEAGFTYGADSLGLDNPQVSWNSGPK